MATPEEKLRGKLDKLSRKAVEQTDRTDKRAQQLTERTAHQAREAGIDVARRRQRTPRK